VPRAAKSAPATPSTTASSSRTRAEPTPRKAAASSGSQSRSAAAPTPKKASSRVKTPPAKKAAPAKAAATTDTAAPSKAPAKKAATKKVTAKKPTDGASEAVEPAESPFDEKFLEDQRALLIEERKRLSHDADNLTAEANALAEGREPGDVQFDEESGEGDTLQVERERDLALSAQFRGQVEEIDRALAKFELGTYGICEVSGTPIPKERLKAIPWARERVEHKVGGFGRR
jgi:RNA polymerase-binding transcription factor DksA